MAKSPNQSKSQTAATGSRRTERKTYTLELAAALMNPLICGEMVWRRFVAALYTLGATGDGFRAWSRRQVRVDV